MCHGRKCKKILCDSILSRTVQHWHQIFNIKFKVIHCLWSQVSTNWNVERAMCESCYKHLFWVSSIWALCWPFTFCFTIFGVGLCMEIFSVIRSYCAFIDLLWSVDVVLPKCYDYSFLQIWSQRMYSIWSSVTRPYHSMFSTGTFKKQPIH